MEITNKDLDCIFPFGKFKGKSIREVGESGDFSPNYINWAFNTIPNFKSNFTKAFINKIKELVNKGMEPLSDSGDMMSNSNSYYDWEDFKF
jgi:hypothetical protein